ncbi:MAG: ADP-ribosylglycohydrolase family protein [Thermodesulfovibrionales bacterium]|nr:ADP-ribosylglycohydrolase family protein [Thermodesulfovibrionales bacterium]
MHLKSKFVGSLLGTHVGDALGAPFEGQDLVSMQSKYGTIREMREGFRSKGCYTDDTEMMIAVAESLIENKGVDVDHMAKQFMKKYHPSRGYRWGTRLAISLMKQGVPWQKVGDYIYDGGSFGNGAAMRIAPAGLFYYDDLEALRRAAYLSSSVTHSHPLGKEGAAIQACAVAFAVLLNPEDILDKDSFILKLWEFASVETTLYRKLLYRVYSFLHQKPSPEEVVALLGNNSTAMGSVPTAIYSFLAHSESFEEALIYAVNLGGDCDTIGAMTGAIAGAYHGKEGIPHRWLNDLENGLLGRTYIEELARSLFRIKLETKKEG